MYKRQDVDKSFPRICGGDPINQVVQTSGTTLFPAYAGVIPWARWQTTLAFPFPRICGGDPIGEQAILNKEIFSPHMRE